MVFNVGVVDFAKFVVMHVVNFGHNLLNIFVILSPCVLIRNFALIINLKCCIIESLFCFNFIQCHFYLYLI